MRVITITNHKGGVGKTTLATHIAGGLALRGFRTVLLDMDQQGHCAEFLGQAKSDAAYYLLTEQSGIQDQGALIEVPHDRYVPEHYQPQEPPELYLIASDKSLGSVPLKTMHDLLALQRLVATLEAYEVDYVIIDKGPAASSLDAMVMLATDGYIYPTQLENGSFDGMLEHDKSLASMVAQFSEYDIRMPPVIGIVPTFTSYRTVLHRRNANRLIQLYGELRIWHAILRRANLAAAIETRRLIYCYATDKPGDESSRIANWFYKLTDNILALEDM